MTKKTHAGLFNNLENTILCMTSQLKFGQTNTSKNTTTTRNYEYDQISQFRYSHITTISSVSLFFRFFIFFF
jgi:hypothetical protein